MALIYFDKRQIVAKLVIVGADGAGSNTNLRSLHGRVTSRYKGEIFSFGADPEETSFVFEYDAPRACVPGFDLRVRVYSLPGRVGSPAHRDLVLRDVDGVLLVLDARPERGSANKSALEDVSARLAGYGRPVERTAVVVQINHRDHLTARSSEAVVVGLALPSAPIIPSNARTAQGVLETHEALVSDVSARLRDNLAGNVDDILLVATTGAPLSDEDLVAQHVSQLSGNVAFGQLDAGAAQLNAAMTRRFLALPPGERVEVAFQPREFAGMRPVHLLDSRLEADGVFVDLVMERLSGGGPKRLPLMLANRPPDVQPVQRHVTQTAASSVTRDLPMKVDMAPPEPIDFPPVWYGVAGIAAGVVVGLLIAYVAFA